MTDTFEQTPLRQYPNRWRLSRAGFVNVWHYYQNTFDISGGRLILRGTNGSGKSRALEMLLPFLLDADRRNMGAGSSVRMEDLMSAGAGDQGNRLGYMWLELKRDQGPEYLTLGALVRFAISTKEAKVWYFSTPLRVGAELPLLGDDRLPLSRRDLAELITEERITDIAEKHRERVRAEVFGLTGHLGKERFDGLVKLLHTLRSPDVGNRIEEGRLPAILADALPPLSEDALTDAGQQLDSLTSTREDQQRLEVAREHVRTFLDAYRKYVTGVLAGSLQTVRTRAGEVTSADQQARQREGEAVALADRITKEKGQLDELHVRADELEAILQGLRESEAYRSAEEIHQLAAVVHSAAAAADSALRAASELRREEADRVADARPLADDADRAAAALTGDIQQVREILVSVGLTEHDLPAEVRVHRRPGVGPTEMLRTARDREPEELVRPAAEVLTLVPADHAEIGATARRVREAARTRAAQAANRAADAGRLAGERRAVDRAADKAGDAEARAVEDAEAAAGQVERREDAGIELVDRWRSWLADPRTAELIGPADWPAHPALGPLLEDRTTLCGDGLIDLADLDRAPDDAVDDADSRLADEAAGLARDDDADRSQTVELTRERAQLRAAHDPDPRPPAWVTDTGGTPLWRCVDFEDSLEAADRAGIEAALLASGLLTATVDGAGTLTAADGQLLVSPTGEPARRPLSTVLKVDRAAPLGAAVVRAVLDRIGLGAGAAVTWIGRDGTWGNGPLRGRHTVAAARHIGAAARAAARAVRLAEIESELVRLAAAADARQNERERVAGRRRALRDHRRAAPRSTALVQARTSAAEALRVAGRSGAAARRLRAEADQLSQSWAQHDREHRRACAEFGLPEDEGSLARIRDTAEYAVSGCDALEGGARNVDRRMARYGEAVRKIAAVGERRSRAETDAAAAWRGWHAEQTRLETLESTVGTAVAEVRRQVSATESQVRTTKLATQAASEVVQRLNREAGSAAAEAATAAARVADLRATLHDAVAVVLDQMDQPGVVQTAFPFAPGPLFRDQSPEAADAEAEGLLRLLRRGRLDQNGLHKAHQIFAPAVSASYDVAASTSAGVLLYDLVDADGRRPLAQAAAEIDRQCEAGRAALTEREHAVFSRFVLGEVGEELRRRLGQATGLISAMNASLRSIRTSHGIGVRLTWKLAEEVAGDVARIKTLVSTAAAVRTADQDTELTGLLSERVAAEATKDPTSGYAVHLRAALDYRSWHTVEVIITGPDQGQERKITRRAKLSQGETRFVSYVTLFAAVDAYLSGLDDGSALRLILLDDAFAKVDDRTIAELLGLLVRLDVDFAMTGHALWGCVPQVPALDIYEICREEGTPAATAHVRWDGRNRHFLHAA